MKMKWRKVPAYRSGGIIWGPTYKSQIGDVVWDSDQLGWMALSSLVAPYRWGPFATADEAKAQLEAASK